MLKGSCIFGQSGGPTSVINASAFGVFDEAFKNGQITRVLGAAHGIKGILNDTLYDMDLESSHELELLKSTPSSALGSCRYKLTRFEKDDTDYKKILDIFKKYDVRYFFYNGGNDSMDTCSKISKYMQSVGYECNIVGVPKTIDNDLFGTDHCPGYGSAAKYIATSVLEVARDACVYDTGSVTIIEIMGRNAGWLTAAASIPALVGQPGADLVFMPEIPFDIERAIEQIREIYKTRGNCIVALSEGIKDKDGVYLAEYAGRGANADAFGHKQMGGAGAYVAGEVKSIIGAKTRSIELSLLQRCAAHCASKTDIEEAVAAGREAVRLATSGMTDVMVAFERNSKSIPYTLLLKAIPLSDVANAENKFPLGWLTADKCGITKDFLPYVLPLIEGESDIKWENGMPKFAKLAKIKVKI